MVMIAPVTRRSGRLLTHTIYAAAITSSGLCQVAVVQRIANIRVLRMCATLRSVNADLRVRDQVVRLLPEVFAVDVSYL